MPEIKKNTFIQPLSDSELLTLKKLVEHTKRGEVLSEEDKRLFTNLCERHYPPLVEGEEVNESKKKDDKDSPRIAKEGDWSIVFRSLQ